MIYYLERDRTTREMQWVVHVQDNHIVNLVSLTNPSLEGGLNPFPNDVSEEDSERLI